MKNIAGLGVSKLTAGIITIWALRGCIGGVLVYSGFVKLQNPLGFLDAVYNFGLVSPAGGLVAAVFVPWAELVVGLCLLTGTMAESAFLLSMLLGTLFVMVQAHAIHEGLRIDCGCFGSSPAHQHLIGAGTLTRACLFLLGSIAGVLLEGFPLRDGNRARLAGAPFGPSAPGMPSETSS
jgi:putative oxidoreductase